MYVVRTHSLTHRRIQRLTHSCTHSFPEGLQKLPPLKYWRASQADICRALSWSAGKYPAPRTSFLRARLAGISVSERRSAGVAVLASRLLIVITTASLIVGQNSTRNSPFSRYAALQTKAKTEPPTLLSGACFLELYGAECFQTRTKSTWYCENGCAAKASATAVIRHLCIPTL